MKDYIEDAKQGKITGVNYRGGNIIIDIEMVSLTDKLGLENQLLDQVGWERQEVTEEIIKWIPTLY